MKNISNFRMLVLAGVLVGVGACQTTSEESSASNSTGSLSSGAKMIADATLKDRSAIKKACKGGRDGVTALIKEKTTDLMKSGQNLDPSKDGPAAGSFVGSKCRDILSS